MHIPSRMCVACRQVKEKEQLIRIVKQTKLIHDSFHKLNGRGAYLCKNEKCIDKAYKKNMFYHKLKLAFDKELYEEIKKVLDE